MPHPPTANQSAQFSLKLKKREATHTHTYIFTRVSGFFSAGGAAEVALGFQLSVILCLSSCVKAKPTGDHHEDQRAEFLILILGIY